MVNAAIRQRLSTLDEELEQMRVKIERIEHASEVGADIRSSLKPTKEQEEEAKVAKARANEPLRRVKSQFHAERFDTPDEETAVEKTLKKAKSSWRQHEIDSQTPGKLEFLHHLETAFGYDDVTGQRVVHKPFEGKLHIVGARGLKDADMFDRSDPYAEVKWNGELIGRTRVMEDSLDPVWNETFVIRVSPTQQNELSIELFDFDGDMFAMRHAQEEARMDHVTEGAEGFDIESEEKMQEIRAAAKRREQMAAIAHEPDFLGEVVLAGQGSRMLPARRTEYTLQRKPGRDRVRLVGNVRPAAPSYKRNIQDTYNAAVGGFLTIWFEGQEEEQEPTAIQVAISQAKQAQHRQSSPKESSRGRRKNGKSRAELDNAKRPFSFRTDPVNLAFGEIKAWEDVGSVAAERGYKCWDEVSESDNPAVVQAAPDEGMRVLLDDDVKTDESEATDTDYIPPSEKELCKQCKLVHPTPPKENVMGKMEFDGFCDHCGGRAMPPKRKVSRMASIPSAGRKKKADTAENPWTLPAHEAERFRAISSMGMAKNPVHNVVRNGRRSGSVSPSRMQSDADSTSPSGASAAKPRLGQVAANRPPPRSTAQGGPKDKLSRTMANWGGGPQVGVEKGYPVNWPSAYPDIGLPFTSDEPVSKAAVISKLTDHQLYTGTHRHRFDRDGKGRGLAGRDYVAKGEGSIQGRRGAHQALCLRQEDNVVAEQTINWGASGNLNQVFGSYRDGLFYRDGFHVPPKGAAIKPRGLVVDDAICLANNALRGWNGFVQALQPLLCMGTMASLHRLDLSHNHLVSVGEELADTCVNLLVLNLHANDIPSLAAIKKLSKLKRLTELSLHGNPFESQIPVHKHTDKGVAFGGTAAGRGRYRAEVVALLPWLRQLDFTSVSPSEREDGLRLRREKVERASIGDGGPPAAATRTMLRKARADRERR